MNKKSHALALKSALSDKVESKNVIVVNEFNTTKTKEFASVLKSLNLEGVKTLIVLHEENEAFVRSARNIPTVKVVMSNNVSVYDLLNAEKLVFTVDSVKAVEGGLK